MSYIRWFKEISKDDIAVAGGKGANLGEMFNAGFPVPPGFAITAQCYQYFIEKARLKDKILAIISTINVDDTEKLQESANEIQKLIIGTEVPLDIREEIIESYEALEVPDMKKVKHVVELASIKEFPFVAVRSSATAEDLPQASFAGQQATFLNVKGVDQLIKAVRACWASLFTARAIYYRTKNDFDHSKVLISVIVQKMVNADKAGVMFSVNPATSNRTEITIEGAFGLGEAVVSGSVNPDLYIVDKGNMQIKSIKVNSQDWGYFRDLNTGRSVQRDIPKEKKNTQKLSDDEILQLAILAVKVEDHYNKPQDMEWAIEKDRLYLVQTRAVTTLKDIQPAPKIEVESTPAPGKKIIVSGISASPGIASGKVKVVNDMNQLDKVLKGDILVTKMTNPDMVPVMERAAAIVTDEGGLTCIEGEARLFTSKGFIKFKDIGDLLAQGEEIKTLSVDAKSKKVVWRKVLLSMKRRARAFEVAPYLHPTNKLLDKVRITPDHKMPVLEGNTLASLQLKDLVETRNNLFVIDKIPVLDNTKIMADCDMHKLMYLCGSIFSDGHIVKRKSGRPMRIMFSQKATDEKKQYIDTVLQYFSDIFNADLKNYTPANKMVAYQGSQWLRAGSFENSKAHPAQTLQRIKNNFVQIVSSIEEKYLISFLSGIIDGDGHFNKQKSWIEIYVNKKEVAMVESIIVACLRLNAPPEVRHKGRNLVVIIVKDSIEKMTRECKRVKAVERIREDRKLFDPKVFKPLELKDWRGSLYNYYKKDIFIGAARLLKYLEGRCEEEKLAQIKELANSDLRMQRLMVVGETDPIDVYNVTIDAPTEENHNYIIFTEHYTPLFVYNCHAAIVSREMGIPCIVGTETATLVLKDDSEITVDANTGKVYAGKVTLAQPTPPVTSLSFEQEIITGTDIKIIADLPQLAEKNAATGADGVGLVRIEFMIANSGTHPAKFIHENKDEDYIKVLMDGIGGIARAFAGKSVWVRTSDIRTDEYRNLRGGDEEPHEMNPMMGWHAIRRGLDEPRILRAEFTAMKRLHDQGLRNVGIMLPFVINVEEVRQAKKLLREIGLEPQKDIEFGVMIETPAACWIIEDLCREGIDFVSFGTNDLTQLTLGIDRDNQKIAHSFSELHPAVLGEIKMVVEACKRYGVKTSICGQAGSDPRMAAFLVKIGIDSISANADAVHKIREVVAHTEKKLVLEAYRKKLGFVRKHKS